MTKPTLTAAIALIVATTAALAGELTVEQVKAKYPSIFDVRPQRFGGRTFFAMSVKDLPASDLLAGFVNENKLLLDYLLMHGSECGKAGAGKGAPGRSAGGCTANLTRDRAFNEAVLPLVARYLATQGVDLVGYQAAAIREEINLVGAMDVAARFFYPDAIRKDGAIQAHVCVGINGLSDLNRPRNLVLEAFVYEAVFDEMLKEKSRMGQDFLDELEAISDLDLSSDPKIRLTRAQGAMWAHMARSRHLRRVLLAEYHRIGSCLPFVLVEKEER